MAFRLPRASLIRRGYRSEREPSGCIDDMFAKVAALGRDANEGSRLPPMEDSMGLMTATAIATGPADNGPPDPPATRRRRQQALRAVSFRGLRSRSVAKLGRLSRDRSTLDLSWRTPSCRLAGSAEADALPRRVSHTTTRIEDRPHAS